MDRVLKSERKEIMRSIKSSNTFLESQVTKILWKKSIRFRKNVNSLKGKPDIAIKKYKIVIFIDSCYWHGCKLHCRMPESNKDYWNNKIKRNQNRDKNITQYYVSQNWNILRVWEHDLKADFNKTIYEILNFIGSAKLSK